MQQTAEGLRFVLPIDRADGYRSNYELLATADGTAVAVGEVESARKFPKSCPERHINRNGTFCMYWPGSDDLRVTDRASAEKWWATLVKFLRLQERADRLKRWPSLEQWAHGAAATYQLQAIEAANRLGPPYSSAVLQNRLTVTDCKNSRRVFLDRKWIYSVDVKRQSVVNKNARCICEPVNGARPKTMRTCADHADAAYVLALTLRLWDLEEQRFWLAQDSTACCQSMTTCPFYKKAA
ncbi:E2 domain-containing protein [Terripilifer ovatus]|uniref:E2 domain-containing protein n=1 Tax=Terripilifer ovatus TaxID=3032367 RepID=UPI003AB929DF